MRQFTSVPVPAPVVLYLLALYDIAVPLVGVKPVVVAGTSDELAARLVEICTVIDANSNEVGAVVGVPPVKLIVGLAVYPEPPDVIVTPVILPLVIIGVPLAVVPPAGGAEKVTPVGATL